MNYEKIIQDLIEKYKISPIDILRIGDGVREYNYLNDNKEDYTRTIRDIDSIFKGDRKHIKILEIGSFLGVVSIALKKLGFTVFALDIPEFFRSSKLQSLYKKKEVSFKGVNLRNTKLPYKSNSLDAVIVCEVIEHFNFNPLPVFQEINRVLKKGGYIYIGMPNQSSFWHRINLLFGTSIHNPIEDFFKQLGKKDNMIVGLHWREYTMQETIELITKMGFDVVTSYYSPTMVKIQSYTVMSILNKILYSYGPFRPGLVVVGKKSSTPNYDFWVTEASS